MRGKTSSALPGDTETNLAPPLGERQSTLCTQCLQCMASSPQFPHPRLVLTLPGSFWRLQLRGGPRGVSTRSVCSSGEGSPAPPWRPCTALTSSLLKTGCLLVIFPPFPPSFSHFQKSLGKSVSKTILCIKYKYTLLYINMLLVAL